MKTPFLGSAYVAKSLNLADQRLINLFPTIVDTKSGKDVGAFYTTPGLTLLATLLGTSVRALSVAQGVLYAVSGPNIYSLTPNFVPTLIGTIDTSVGLVSVINNGTQIAFFDGVNGYLVPGGFPLTGGTISAGGTDYSVGDDIVLQAADGQQNATAVITVTTVSTGAVTGFSIELTGAFNPTPTSFTQSSTSGSGTGFTLSSPTFGAFTPIYLLTLPFPGPVSATYQDGFGLVNVAGTNQWYQSNLDDLSIWDPLNFSSADAAPDNVRALADLHREVFLFKENETEVWVNAGQAGFSFQRLEGVYIQMGIAAVNSVALAGEALIWLGQNQQGRGIVVMATGYEPIRISTHAIEGAIQSYPTMADAVAYAYQEAGHIFYVLSFPAGNATWVFDLSTHMWHQRAAFSNGQFSRHQSNCYAFFDGKHVVGDYQNGNIYSLDEAAQTDNGATRKWVRSWRALQQPVFDPVRFNALQIDMQTGIGVPDGTNPQCVLRWSDDGGHNWSNERFAAAGQTGQTALRVMFRRLGSTRRNSGLDRYFELSSTDVFGVGLIGADLT